MKIFAIGFQKLKPSGQARVVGYRAFAIPTVFGDYLPMVEFRLRTGHRFGFSYAWLTATNGTQVTIRGRHLLALYTALVRHQVVSVNEADEPTSLLVAESQPVVESIEKYRIQGDRSWVNAILSRFVNKMKKP